MACPKLGKPDGMGAGRFPFEIGSLELRYPRESKPLQLEDVAPFLRPVSAERALQIPQLGKSVRG